ncbi:hypothetical protein D3C78_1586980 [compost metagenome]
MFEPLGIGTYKWEVDPQGIHTGGFGLWLRPTDMLKFGQLYLQQGTWSNKQLISRELVAQSVKPHISVDAPYRGSYGWHWWTDSYFNASDIPSVSPMSYYYARGYGGQYIYVIPSKQTVVVLSDDKRKKKQVTVEVFREIISPLLVMQ